MIINHNLNALNAHRQMGINNTSAGKAMEKLSSGLRINRAGDDAAGLSISEKMRAQIRGLNMASKNAQDGISLIQTAEGALSETQAILQRMRELAVQASNDTNVEVDRKSIQGEIDQLVEELDRIGNTTQFNTQNLIDGSLGEDAVSGSSQAYVMGKAIADENGKLTYAGAGMINGIGSLIGDDAKLVLTIDGKKIEIDLTEDGNNVPNATNELFDLARSSVDTNTELSGVASALQADINNAIANYNLTVPASEQLENVTVSVNEGRLVVTNGNPAGEPGSIAFDNSIAAGLLGLENTNSKSSGGGIKFQIGANENQTIEVKIDDMRAFALGVDSIDVTQRTSAETAIETINDAIETVSAERSKLGAYQNRLEHTIKNLDNTSENVQAAESRIRDVDMAKEMMEFTKNNILQQAAQAMLAQANNAPQGVLQLLR